MEVCHRLPLPPGRPGDLPGASDNLRR